jgi:pimeloyl-ACP methyl ester carboxylesterase
VTGKAIPALLIAVSMAMSPAQAGDVASFISGSVRTCDGVDISYDHYRRGFDSVIIVCPGFFNGKSNRWMRKACEMLSEKYDVIALDFRGHGSSGSKYTWSAREDLDLDAVLDYAISGGYKHVGILAFSLGAAAAVNEAAKRGGIESMVLISCPSKASGIDFHFWEPGMFSDLIDNIECKWEGKGARSGSMFMKKTDPVESIKNMKNTAVLFIHGDNDWVVKPRHSKRLYEAAPAKKKLEIVKGGLHAERLLQFHYESVKKMILDWFSETLK